MEFVFVKFVLIVRCCFVVIFKVFLFILFDCWDEVVRRWEDIEVDLSVVKGIDVDRNDVDIDEDMNGRLGEFLDGI